MAENHPSAPHPPQSRSPADLPRESIRSDAGDPSGSSAQGSSSDAPPYLEGPSVARVAPVLSLVEWRDREKQEQIDRLLEILDDLRKHVIAGQISTLAVAGVVDGQEFCQWEGAESSVLYALELAKEELLHGVRFGDEDAEEIE